MKTLISSVLFILFFAVPSHAFLGFGDGEKASFLKDADSAFNDAAKAKTENRFMDEMTFLSDAYKGYYNISKTYPDYKSKHVNERIAASSGRLRILLAQVKAGQINVPTPEETAKGAGQGYVSAPAAKPSNETHSKPMPALVPTSSLQYDATGRVVIRPDAQTQTPATPRGNVSTTPRVSSANAKKSYAARAKIVEDFIADGEAADAVIVAEEFVAEDGAAASIETRLLLVRALIEVRNYNRATAELARLNSETRTPTPAMISFSAALAMQKGDYTAAIFQIDKLIDDYPDYADARVNMAYILYLSDPKSNAGIAMISYRTGITLGAKRDPAFERALGITVEN